MFPQKHTREKHGVEYFQALIDNLRTFLLPEMIFQFRKEPLYRAAPFTIILQFPVVSDHTTHDADMFPHGLS